MKVSDIQYLILTPNLSYLRVIVCYQNLNLIVSLQYLGFIVSLNNSDRFKNNLGLAVNAEFNNSVFWN